MRNREISAVAGILVGVAGIVALGLLLKKFSSNKKIEAFEENLVEKIVEYSPFKKVKKQKSKKIVTTLKKRIVASRKKSKLAVAKLGNAKKLLSFMKKGKEYTQVMLEEVSKIPYRSVRRYIEVLEDQGRIIASGYGKGKKFLKK